MRELRHLADDYFINMHLNTEIPLPTSRETVLTFFERVQKTYPTMRNFFKREIGDFVLEEDKDQDHYRWLSLDSKRLCSCTRNPESADDAVELHREILELAPYMLSVSTLDCEALDLLFGFDFRYRGNHDALIAEVMGGGAHVESMRDIPGVKTLSYEPSITIALDESCRRQARLQIETRTNAYQVRKNTYPEEVISVYVTVRQYGSLAPQLDFVTALGQLYQDAERLLEDALIEQVLQPLAAAIQSQ